MLRRLREPVNGLTHFFTALVAVGGLVLLMVLGWGRPGKEASLAIYGISVILLFAASAAYHMVSAQPKVIAVLRKLDHSAIYLLIAGSYTPFFYNLFAGYWKWGVLIGIWSLALIGIIVKLFIIKVPRWVNAGVYLLMGWLSIVAIREMLIRVPTGALVWLLVGGVIYSLGAVIYSTKAFNFVPGKFGFHEVWHIFVILGALAHYIAVAVYVAPLA